MLQPELFRLAARPDSLVSDESNENIRKIGLIEMKNKNNKMNDLVHDQSFILR